MDGEGEGNVCEGGNNTYLHSRSGMRRLSRVQCRVATASSSLCLLELSVSSLATAQKAARARCIRLLGDEHKGTAGWWW